MGKCLFHWTCEDEKYIIENWGKESAHSMKAKFNCSWQTVVNKAISLGLETPKNPKWTKEEELLKKLSKKLHYKKIARKMGKSENAIMLKARRLGIILIARRSWTKKEEELLKKYWGKYQIEKIAQKMQRTVYSVKVKATRLHLGYMSQNNEEELPVSEISELLNVRSERITSTWFKLGLVYKTKKVTNKKGYFCVEFEDLLLFLENHQDLWNSKYLEKNIFGEEPEWLLEKRRFDSLYGGPQDYRVWSQREINIAKDLLMHGYSYEYISYQINRTPTAIAYKMREIGMRYRLKQFWKGSEIKAVIENYPFITAQEISEKLIDRSVKTIQWKAAELGIKKRILKNKGLSNKTDNC